MLYRNIAKFFLLVIFCSTTAACRHGLLSDGERPQFDKNNSPYSAPEKAGRIESSEITESSGIAASRCQPSVIWTHNDSGDGPFLYALDPTGRDLGAWKVANAENIDWEDIAAFKDAAGKCFLYVGDIGNNEKNPRPEGRIYRIAEPKVPAGGPGPTRKDPAATSAAEMLVFSYPEGPRDAETLMVHPVTGEIYIVSKIRNTYAAVYRLAPSFGSAPSRAQKVTDIAVPAIPNGFLTGGDIAPNGKRLVICDYFAGYEYSLPTDSKDFDEIWKQKPVVIDLGDRKQGESVAYSADGNSLYATSEGKKELIVRLDRRK